MIFRCLALVQVRHANGLSYIAKAVFFVMFNKPRGVSCVIKNHVMSLKGIDFPQCCISSRPAI
jgi:hypothetical protein